jgi:predicted Zn-dependent protease
MFRVLATGVIALGMLAGCTTSPTGRSQLMFMPESQMTQMGLQAFDNIKKETPVDKDATTNAYVQCVGQAITREVGRGSWEIVVFEDNDANAFALPGNKIGVNTGLLKVAENQDQLATVIGHEVAHVLSHHSNERVSQKFAVQEGLALITAMASPHSATGQSMMGLLGVGAQYGILMPYSRIQESEADRLGLDLMAKAGFNPRESLNLWKNMTRAGGDQPPEFLSTHPSYGTRITDLNAHLPVALRLQQKALQLGRHPSCHPSP